jgi:hypothetical protein
LAAGGWALSPGSNVTPTGILEEDMPPVRGQTEQLIKLENIFAKKIKFHLGTMHKPRGSFF